MRPPTRAALGAAILTLAAFWAPPVPGADPGAPPTAGWRGNWTGLYPAADPPVRWGRTLAGVVAGMTCQAARPAEGAPAAGQALDDGLVRDWLIVGPFPVADSVKDLDQAQVPGEAELRPAEGDKAGGKPWQRLELKKPPDYDRWGTTEMDWIDLAEPLGYKPNQVAYAHTYLYCHRAGKVRAVVEHAHGMKAWLNGQAVYTNADRGMALGSYVGISRQKQALVNYPSPRFEMTLRQGWNRLLVKLGTYNRPGWRSLQFTQRFVDVEPVPYRDENIAWVAELPERTNAAPVIVGDRIFTPAEPDELLCLDKRTGKILWRRLNGFFEATPEAERAAKAVLKEKIAPLAEKLQAATDYEKSLELRREIRDLLVEADKRKYELKWDGHLASHFGIVGFTTTPASDGRSVYTFVGQGVVACYDLEGNRRWIRRLEAEEIRYSCSPALIGDRLVVIFGGMHGLDARTGKTAWQQPDVTSIAALIPATIRGTDVVATRDGRVFRAADGKLLWSNPHIRQGDTGWAAPLIVDDVMYLPWVGVGGLIVADFSEVSGDAWQPKLRVIEVGADHRRPGGEWLDRWTAGSPVVHEGMYYNIDQYGVFYAVELATGKTLYRKDMGFDELHHYNAIGVGASPTLGGRYVYVLDNQGACAVLELGGAYKPVAVNRLQTVLQRPWAIGPQELVSNAPPVFEGRRMYLRGERHLYCIGSGP